MSARCLTATQRAALRWVEDGCDGPWPHGGTLMSLVRKGLIVQRCDQDQGLPPYRPTAAFDPTYNASVAPSDAGGER